MKKSKNNNIKNNPILKFKELVLTDLKQSMLKTNVELLKTNDGA